MSGLAELTPTVTSPAERLAEDFQEVYQRLGDLEASRSAVSFGHGPPVDASGRLGSQYVDLDSARYYVLGPGGWFSADVARGTAFAAATVSATATAFSDLGGPSVSLTVPASGIVLAYLDVELAGATSGASTATAEVGLYEPTDIPTPSAGIQSAATSFARRVSAPSNNFGAEWPRGDFFTYMPAAAGAKTFSIRYATTLAGVACQFRNRRLTVLVI